jgi:uncharacterized protein (TIGR03083 family)
MRIEHREAQTAFLDQLNTLVDACTGLTDDQLLAASRCRGWTAGDVLVHVHLGLQDMLLGLVTPTDTDPDTDAASYWRREVPTNDPDADRIAAVRFVRLLGAAYRRPTGLVNHLRPTAHGIARAVAALPPGALRFQGHVLSTGDFLTTWAVELAVHHLDLGRELELDPPAPAAVRLARTTVESLAEGQLPKEWSDELTVLLGTGRLRPNEHQARQAGVMAHRLPVLG